METEKDKELWKTAKKRVAFKRHLGTYIIVNTLLWLLWFFTDNLDEAGSFPWPVWPMVGWGIGLVFNYRSAYLNPKDSAIQKEYDKLKKKEG